MELSQHLDVSQEIRALIGCKDGLNNWAIAEHIKRVHEVLRARFNNYKHNKFQNMLLYHLYEAMPEHESLRKLLPRVDV